MLLQLGAEGGRTLGRMGVPQGECADARGAKTLCPGATAATVPLLARNRASMWERKAKLLSR